MVDLAKLGYRDEQELDEMRKDRETVVHLRRKPADKELNDLDRRMVNTSARITVPLHHTRQLRRIADQLRALAGRLEVISANTEDRERVLLLEAWMDIRDCDRKIKNIGEGKPSSGKQNY